MQNKLSKLAKNAGFDNFKERYPQLLSVFCLNTAVLSLAITMRLCQICLFCFAFSACKDEGNPARNQLDKLNNEEISDTAFDSELATKFKADEYGMRKFVMAFLKKGPNRNQDSATAIKLQKAHMENINKMAKEGKLILAGPFLDDADLRGIYIFDVETIEEAKALTETDPAIRAGRLSLELHPWYGSAALMGINQIHKELSQKAI